MTDKNLDIEKLIKELEKEVKALKNVEEKEDALMRLQEIAKTYSGDDKVISSLQIAEDLKLRPEVKKILTGYPTLDEVLGGFVKKQLVVISAPTKSGKTTFCIELTARMKANNPLWLPFEEPAEELVQKFLDRKEMPPLFYTPERMLGNTLVWIEKKIVEAKAKYNSELVFIDHLHFIVPPGTDDINQRIGLTMRELKKLAVKWNVVIVLIAHLRKTRLEENPTLEDLRDSSFIAQEADTVIILWREAKREKGKIEITNNVNISIQANRRTGKTGNVEMVYLNGRFIEMEWMREEEEEIISNWHGK